MSHLVEILLPLFAKGGDATAPSLLQDVKDELTQRYGGLTAFTRAPAEGRWKDDNDDLAHDDIVVFEVMVDTVDRAWWRDYRIDLERRFRQDELVIRAHAIDLL